MDALLTPSAPGEAPRGLESTGDPAFCRVWTLLHVPCVNVPAAMGPRGLPVGVQLVGRPYEEELLLEIGLRMEEARGPFPALPTATRRSGQVPAHPRVEAPPSQDPAPGPPGSDLR